MSMLRAEPFPAFPLIQLSKCNELLLNQELNHNHTLLPFPSATLCSARLQPGGADLQFPALPFPPHLSPHSFFIMSSTFLARSAGLSWASPLAANFATYISANCLRVKAQPCRPEPKPTVPSTGSIWGAAELGQGSSPQPTPPQKLSSTKWRFRTLRL